MCSQTPHAKYWYRLDTSDGILNYLFMIQVHILYSYLHSIEFRCNNKQPRDNLSPVT